MTYLTDTELHTEALHRIIAAQELAAAVGDMAVAVRALPPDKAQKLYPAFLLLAECQAALLSAEALPREREASEQAQRATDGNVARLVYLWRALQHVDAGQRVEIIRTRTKWSKSKIYRLRAAAEEAGLL